MNIHLVMEQFYDNGGDGAEAIGAGNPVRAFIIEDDAMRCCQKLNEETFRDMTSGQLVRYLHECESTEDIELLVGKPKDIRAAFSKHEIPLPYYEESIELEDDGALEAPDFES